MSPFRTKMTDAFRFSALEILGGVLQKGRSNFDNWNETDNMINVIVPVLTLMAFGQYNLASKKSAFSQPVRSSHQPDYEVRGIGKTLAVLEAKPFGMPLAGRNQSANYVTPLDQILTYLDRYGDVYGFLTNGSQWCLLRRLHGGHGMGIPTNAKYICALFDLEGSFGRLVDDANLEAFAGMCHASRLFSCPWPDLDLHQYTDREVSRSGGSSIILLRDFSYGTVLA